MEDWRSYDRVAEVYERVHAPRFAVPAADLVGLAGIGPGSRVLDLGTGTGVTADAADAAGAEVVGVDPSLGMLAEGRRARPHLRLAAADAIDLPFRDGTFDAVTANFVLGHVTRVDTVLFDVLRVLRPPAGTFACSVWADADDPLQQTWFELALEVAPRDLLNDAWRRAQPQRAILADPRRLDEALRRAGFETIRVTRERYRFDYALDEFVEGLGAFTTGRFVRGMLGEAGWGSFMQRARARFAERFPDPLHDFRDALLATGRRGG
jgi:ubiquinone/menaquinone biosynthesis C-methylase UbiE